MSEALLKALDAAKIDYKLAVRDLAQNRKVGMEKVTELAIHVGKGLQGLTDDVAALKPVIEADKYIANAKKVHETSVPP